MKTFYEMVEEKYGLKALTKKEYEDFKTGILIACNADYLTFEGTMLLLDKTKKVISDITGVDTKVLDCLTFHNIKSIFDNAICYDDIQKNLMELIEVYNACKKVGAEKDYTIMTRYEWNEEYDYWFWEDDEEELINLNSYKEVLSYRKIKYICDVDIDIKKQ